MEKEQGLSQSKFLNTEIDGVDNGQKIVNDLQSKLLAAELQTLDINTGGHFKNRSFLMELPSTQENDETAKYIAVWKEPGAVSMTAGEINFPDGRDWGQNLGATLVKISTEYDLTAADIKNIADNAFDKNEMIKVLESYASGERIFTDNSPTVISEMSKTLEKKADMNEPIASEYVFESGGAPIPDDYKEIFKKLYEKLGIQEELSNFDNSLGYITAVYMDKHEHAFRTEDMTKLSTTGSYYAAVLNLIDEAKNNPEQLDALLAKKPEDLKTLDLTNNFDWTKAVIADLRYNSKSGLSFNYDDGTRETLNTRTGVPEVDVISNNMTKISNFLNALGKMPAIVSPERMSDFIPSLEGNNDIGNKKLIETLIQQGPGGYYTMDKNQSIDRAQVLFLNSNETAQNLSSEELGEKRQLDSKIVYAKAETLTRSADTQYSLNKDYESDSKMDATPKAQKLINTIIANSGELTKMLDGKTDKDVTTSLISNELNKELKNIGVQDGAIRFLIAAQIAKENDISLNSEVFLAQSKLMDINTMRNVSTLYSISDNIGSKSVQDGLDALSKKLEIGAYSKDIEQTNTQKIAAPSTSINEEISSGLKR